MKNILLATMFGLGICFSSFAQTTKTTTTKTSTTTKTTTLPQTSKIVEVPAGESIGTVDSLVATDSLALVRFLITDFDKIPEQDAVINISNEALKLKISVVANVEGRYNVLLPAGKKYKISIDKFGKNFNFGEMDIPKFDGPVDFEQVLQIKVVTRYLDSYNLDNVYFDTGKSTIKPESFKALNLLVQGLKEDVRKRVEIAGHTDNQGDPAKNLVLSQERANAVKKYLQERGINPSRLIAKGYGDLKPVAPNDTPSNKARNRRTEVKTIGE